MVENLPRKPDVYLLKNIILPNWDPTNVVGFDPNAAVSDDAFIDWADSFNKVGEFYPQFTIQTTGAESSGGETTYDFIGTNGPGQNRLGSLEAQVRVEDTKDSDTRYTGDSTTYSAVDAERLATLVRQEIERIIRANPTGASTDFATLGSNENNIPDEKQSTRVVRRAGVTIQYSWVRG